MVSIRLSRKGKKKQPTYRIVVQESTKDPWGDYLENLGHYNPLTKPKTLVVKKERVLHWIANGAQPSDTVWNLLVGEGIITGEKRRTVSISKKRKTKLDAEAAKRKEKESKPPAPEAAA